MIGDSWTAQNRLLTPCLGKGLAAFGDEAVDPGSDNGQRHRAELERRIVGGADVEFRPERLLRFFAGTHHRELATRTAVCRNGTNTRPSAILTALSRQVIPATLLLSRWKVAV